MELTLIQGFSILFQLLKLLISPYDKKPGSVNPSLRPVTIKQLIEASQTHAEAGFRIDGQEINQVNLLINLSSLLKFILKVCLVACIRQKTAQPSGFSYLVEDGTGCVEGRRWSEQGDVDVADGPSSPEEGSWVRIIGNLRAFGGKKSINIYDLRPLEDFNELMFHFASCLLSHNYALKGTYVCELNFFFLFSRITCIIYLSYLLAFKIHG
jgi:replication factor A2